MNNQTTVKSATVKLTACCALFALAFLPQLAGAAGWGTIKGKFKVDGSAPTPPKIDASKEAFCVEHQPIDQSIVVDDQGNLANVVVFLRTGRNEKVDVHPDYDAAKDEPAVLDNKCLLVPAAYFAGPHGSAIRNQELGHGRAQHQRAAAGQRRDQSRRSPPAGKSKRVLTKAEAVPMPVDCNIHPFMHGWILVKEDPYMVASAADGTFEIKNVPAGKREFEFWHEKPGRLKKLKYQGGALNQQGRATLTVADGQTLDVGEIKVPASMLK